jgi:hypothetical protein
MERTNGHEDMKMNRQWIDITLHLGSTKSIIRGGDVLEAGWPNNHAINNQKQSRYYY